MKRILAVVAVAAVAAFARNANAGSASVNVPVSATINSMCTIGNPGAIAFGVYDPLVTNAAANLDSAGSVDVACTVGTAPSLEIGNGGNFDAVDGRRMSSGGGFLRYELYRNAGRTLRFGVTADSQQLAIAAFPSTAAQSIPIYGRIFAGQTAAPVGAYSDTVLATVQF